MANNFFRVKNGLNLPTLAADPTVTPPTNSQPGDIAMYNGDLYIRGASTWSRTLTGSIDTAEIEDDAVTADKLADNAVVNANVDAAAAIEGTKISPNFGAQNVQTTGSVSGTTVSGTAFLGNAIGASGDTSMKNIYGYGRIESPVQTAEGAGNLTIDCSNKHIAKKTGGDADIELLNLAEGQTFILEVTSTGSPYTITWLPSVKWPDATVPTPSAGGSLSDIYTFIKIGGQIFGAATLGMG